MELKNSQIHPSPKGKGLLWQEDKELTLADREWKCDCGTTHNRDHNAAINIRNFGIRTVGTTGIAQECLYQ